MVVAVTSGREGRQIPADVAKFLETKARHVSSRADVSDSAMRLLFTGHVFFLCVSELPLKISSLEPLVFVC